MTINNRVVLSLVRAEKQAKRLPKMIDYVVGCGGIGSGFFGLPHQKFFKCFASKQQGRREWGRNVENLETDENIDWGVNI